MTRRRASIIAAQAVVSLILLAVVWATVLRPEDSTPPGTVNAPHGGAFSADASFDRDGGPGGGERGREAHERAQGAAGGGPAAGEAGAGAGSPPGALEAPVAPPGGPLGSSPSDDQYADSVARILAPVTAAD